MLLHQMRVYSTGRQDHRHGRPFRPDTGIGQHDMGGTAADGVFGLPAEHGGIASRSRPSDRECAVDDLCRVAHMDDHGLMLGRGQDRAVEL